MSRYIIFLLTIQSFHVIISNSKSIIRTLPGYPGDLPFKLETGYVGIGKNESVQLFYYFVESTRDPIEDPLIIHMAGGPGASALVPFLHEIGPLNLNWDIDGIENPKLTLDPNSWTQMANILFVEIPAGSGFSYSKTDEGWISSDSILTTQFVEFIKKFMKEHPKFLLNPLYISGMSYVGIIVPQVTLKLYEDNEHGDQPALNVQGYILNSPLTDKFMDFNSRLEYAHRMALISDNIYKSAINSCHGNYVDTNTDNLACLESLQSYEECTSHINFESILDIFCDENDPMVDCEGQYRKSNEIEAFIMTYQTDFKKAANNWANNKDVQQALNVRQGKIGKWVVINETLHYHQGKNDTSFYSYDIFSSISYHKKLSSKHCRALIVSGDHDLTFPYVGVEQWIISLNLQVEVPWKPFYVDGQVGGYETKYTQNNYSLTYATVKGAGHMIPRDKPKESLVLTQGWFSSQAYSSDS